MTLGEGIAIAAIWGAVACSMFALGVGAADHVGFIFGGFIATVAVCVAGAVR